jgi:hypothetical protein
MIVGEHLETLVPQVAMITVGGLYVGEEETKLNFGQDPEQ